MSIATFSQEDIYDKFVERVVERTKAIIQGDPFNMNTQVGAQASNDQYEKIFILSGYW